MWQSLVEPTLKILLVFSIDSLGKAQKFASRALATSNIECDEESDNDSGRPRKRACIRNSLEESPDYSETESMLTLQIFIVW